MNLTIPIRAQSSKRSWSRQLQGKSSARFISSHRNAERKRYIFTVITATLLIGTLVVGSVGGLIQSASALSGYDYYFNNLTKKNDASKASNATTKSGATGSSSSSNASKTTTSSANTSKTTTPTVVTPTQTTQTTTPAPAATTAPAAAAPVTTTTTAPVAKAVAPAATVAPASPTVVDTAPASAALTTAQAADKSAATAQTVNYTSNRISDETRNRILMFAGVAAVTATLLYTISLIGAGVPAATRRAIPVRYIVPIKEGIAR